MLFKEGIYFSKTSTTVSYPKKGNDICHGLENNSYWFKHRNRCIVSIVKTFSNNETFFDIGGGNGFVTHDLQLAGIESVLLEPNINAIIHAKNRGLKYLICSSLENTEFKKESISAAGIFDVIEHVNNELDFLKKIHFFLRKNGKLYITVPAFQFLWSDEDIFAGHFRRYTIRNIKSRLEKVGFKLIYSTYFFSILLIPIFLFRSIPALFRRRQKGNSHNYKKEHKLNQDLIGFLFNKSFEWELNRINKLKNVLSGSSCLIVAQKA